MVSGPAERVSLAAQLIDARSASLMHGWIPAVVQVLTIGAFCYAIGWRTRRWRILWLPVSAVVGAATAVASHHVIEYSGIAGEPAPWVLWPWVALSAMAISVTILGWTGARWWRRNASVFSMSFCLLSTGLVINGWIGYFPTVNSAWSQLASRPLAGQTDLATVMAMRASGARVDHGRLVPVNINADASGFRHRAEWVYLPPVWFSGDDTAAPPAVMMIGGEFNTPADWIRAGDAPATLDAFAATHHGNAPVVVFVDPSGAFTTDTECVNGSRGNAADHLTKDVVPYVVSHFGVRTDRWGVVGFSAGGTCAVDLAVMHPTMFGAFVDIAGDLRPNAGTPAQTIERLFAGDQEAWASFDPTTAMMRHGAYSGVSGLFLVPKGGRHHNGYGQDAADTLCAAGRSQNIACTTASLAGRHDWPFASAAFGKALPWLAGQLHTAAVPMNAPP